MGECSYIVGGKKAGGKVTSSGKVLEQRPITFKGMSFLKYKIHISLTC